jgi:hypothetical protein
MVASNGTIGLALIILIAAVTLPFRYDLTLSEPDLVRMMAAMVYGHASSGYEGAGQHYGLTFSFGYYRLLYWLTPSDWLRSPDKVTQFINVFGIVSGLLSASTCVIFLSSLFDRSVSWLGTILFYLSPMMLPVVLSGHPLMVATACLFLAGWMFLVADSAPTVFRRVCVSAGATILLTIGLTMRAEIAIAFPFLVVVAMLPRSESRIAWKTGLSRLVLLAASFSIFLYLQQYYISGPEGGGEVLFSFIETFMSLSRITRGLGILIISVGFATTLALIAAFLPTIRDRRVPRREILVILALALPSLALWLPNPQPARHLFFAALSLCLLLAILLVGWKQNLRILTILSLTLVLLNQWIAETLHPIVVSKYQWSYPVIVQRRGTQQMPIGAFPMDQLAHQSLAEYLRDEAIRVSKGAPDHLIVFSDGPHSYYLIAHLVAQNPSLSWVQRRINGILVHELHGISKHFAVVEKSSAWPRDVQAEILNYEQWQEWPVYVQPSARSRFDRMEIPTNRQVKF